MYSETAALELARAFIDEAWNHLDTGSRQRLMTEDGFESFTRDLAWMIRALLAEMQNPAVLNSLTRIHFLGRAFNALAGAPETIILPEVILSCPPPEVMPEYI